MKLKNNAIFQKCFLILMTIVTSISFCLNIYNINIIINKIESSVIKGSVASLIKSNDPFYLGTFGLLVFGFFFYKVYEKYYFKGYKNNYTTKILASLFSIFLIFGKSYNISNSWYYIFGNYKLFLLSIIVFIGYYIFFTAIINLLYEFLQKEDLKEKTSKNKYLNFIFNEHPFICTFIILLICYLPYIIAFYPGILSPDPSNQIKQFFGLDTQYRNYSIMLSDKVFITNHHPVLHTVILGGLAYFGSIFNNVNLGIFIYSAIQTLLLLSILSYSIVYMKKLNTKFKYRLIMLIIYAFVPIYPLYAMSTLKDVIFAILIMFYILKLYELIKNANENIYDFKKSIILIITMILITLFRNNGIYLILMSFPFMLLIDKNNRKKILIILVIPLVFYYGFTNILLPTLKITKGSVREVLSIPFQQTARYVKEYENEVTPYEKGVIDKILTYEDLKDRYDPEISDPVKNKYNKYATKEDLKEYFGVWFKQFLNHPNVYFEATINNTYGYVYPDAKKWYVYFNYDKRLIDSGINYHYNSLKNTRKILSGYASIFPYIPVIGSIVSIGFCTWICMLIIAFILRIKAYKYLIYMTPFISLFLVCIASPVNTYFRYTLGYTMAIPILITICLWIIDNYKKERK